MDQLQSELEVWELMVCGYIGSLVRSAKQIPADKWNWSFSERTPTAREICEHTLIWLWCDRMQIEVPVVGDHTRTPPLPTEQGELIRLLEEEKELWRALIKGLTSEQLGDLWEPFGDSTRNLRGFFFHMAQHIIAKVGQLAMIFFELGLDGGGPYTGPVPDFYYGFTSHASWPSPRDSH